MQLYYFRSDLLFHCYTTWYEIDLEACLRIPIIIVHNAIGLNASFPPHSFLLLLFSFEFPLKWWLVMLPPILCPCSLPQTHCIYDTIINKSDLEESSPRYLPWAFVKIHSTLLHVYSVPSHRADTNTEDGASQTSQRQYSCSSLSMAIQHEL